MGVHSHNAADLQADLYNRIPSDGEVDTLGGVSALGDINARFYRYDASSSASDNPPLVIKPTLQTGNGRWLIFKPEQEQSDWNETNNALNSFIKNKPTVPQAASQSSVTPALDTSAQIHATRNCIVSYPVSISVTSTLLGTNSGSVFLEISPDNSAWTGIAQIGNSVAGVVSTTIGTHVLTGMVPANYYRRLRTAQAGTNGATITSLQGQEVLI